MTQSNNHREELACTNCGQIFYRSKSYVKRQTNRGQKNFYCCASCLQEYQRKQTIGSATAKIIQMVRDDPSLPDAVIARQLGVSRELARIGRIKSGAILHNHSKKIPLRKRPLPQLERPYVNATEAQQMLNISSHELDKLLASNESYYYRLVPKGHRRIFVDGVIALQIQALFSRVDKVETVYIQIYRSELRVRVDLGINRYDDSLIDKLLDIEYDIRQKYADTYFDFCYIPVGKKCRKCD